MKPVRIQRKRKPPKSDRLPDHKRRSYIDSLSEAGVPIDDMTDEELAAELDRIVYVGRPTKWGNPWDYDCYTRQSVILFFHNDLLKGRLSFTVEDVRRELRGKNLCCWCGPNDECHADVLLEIANRRVPL